MGGKLSRVAGRGRSAQSFKCQGEELTKCGRKENGMVLEGWRKRAGLAGAEKKMTAAAPPWIIQRELGRMSLQIDAVLSHPSGSTEEGEDLMMPCTWAAPTLREGSPECQSCGRHGWAMAKPRKELGPALLAF